MHSLVPDLQVPGSTVCEVDTHGTHKIENMHTTDGIMKYLVSGVCVHTTMHSLVPDLQVSSSSMGEVDTHSMHTTESIYKHMKNDCKWTSLCKC